MTSSRSNPAFASTAFAAKTVLSISGPDCKVVPFGDKEIILGTRWMTSSAMDYRPRKSEASWKGWRHSDIKDLALPFVRGVFETMKGAVPQ